MNENMIMRLVFKKIIKEDDAQRLEKEIQRDLNEEAIIKYFSTPYWSEQKYLENRRKVLENMDKEVKHKFIITNEGIIEREKIKKENSEQYWTIFKKDDSIFELDDINDSVTEEMLKKNEEELDRLFGE